MLRTYRIDNSIAKLINKSTIHNVFSFLDTNDVESPCLVIDKTTLQKNVSTIGKQINNCKVFYAVKANPEIEILKILNTLGIGFEIASDGELKILSDLNIEPERIISSNPIKTIRFLKDAASYGLKLFAFDSVAEVDKLSEYIPACSVYVRLSVPNEGSEWPLSKKFGVELEEAESLLLYAKNKGLVPIGITFHVGSQCTNLYNWNIALDKVKILWDRVKERGIDLKLLNLGGGYPINYTKNVIDILTIENNVNDILRRTFPDVNDVHLEPGRAIVGDAGILVTQVIGKTKRMDGNWLYIDIGVFNGLMESLGGIKYAYILGTYKNEYEKKVWTLAGPSCDSFDVIDKNVILDDPDVGDFLLILSSGAYTTSYASEFNGFSLPKTIII